ncbi:hypothetical protein ACWEOP_27950 [Streptomyces chartreusis]
MSHNGSVRSPIMTEAQIALAAARAAISAGQLVKASTNPYVMVKHGRREDRAAVYDRFIAACAASFHDGELDRADVTELLAALQAVSLRAPKHVRKAADDLFDRIAGRLGFTRGGWQTADDSDLTMPTPDERPGQGDFSDAPDASQSADKDAWWRRLFSRTDADPGTWPGRIHNRDTLLMALEDFTRIARLDVLERWWHKLLTPWVKRWLLNRK